MTFTMVPDPPGNEAGLALLPVTAIVKEDEFAIPPLSLITILVTTMWPNSVLVIWQLTVCPGGTRTFWQLLLT